MNTGKLVRLNRIFAHNSGRLCSVAVDHFTIYYNGLPEGLRDVPSTLKAVVKGRPDAVTMHIGMAKNAWAPYAGDVPLIIQSSMLRFDDTSRAQAATPEDAVRLGADAFAIACFVRGPTEWEYMQKVAEAVRQAERFDIPVICHIYPRTFKDGKVEVSFTPEDIAWAARCASELGVDVIKVPYCGDVQAYAQIVEAAPVRVVAAGGPKAPDLQRVARHDGGRREKRRRGRDHRPQHLGICERDGQHQGLQGRHPRRHEPRGCPPKSGTLTSLNGTLTS